MRIYRGDVRHRTFTMLWCEECGSAREVRRAAPSAISSMAADAPLLCVTCDEPLTLLAAFVHPDSRTRGTRIVATLDAVQDAILGDRR